MKPMKREFEQVEVDTWLKGEISKIEYDPKHEFTFKGEKSTDAGVKIAIALDGYKEKKSTGWWKFNYSEKSKVFKFFLQPLVEGAHPKLDFDFDHLLNMRIKVMYAQNGEYQNLVMVRPDQSKIIPITHLAKPAVPKAAATEEEVPF